MIYVLLNVVQVLGVLCIPVGLVMLVMSMGGAR